MCERAFVAALLLCAGGVMIGAAVASAEDSLPEFIESNDVCFPHAMHFDDLGIECGSCHHETNAAPSLTSQYSASTQLSPVASVSRVLSSSGW